MATDREIQKFVEGHNGFIPKAGWIAHVKEVHGIPTVRGGRTGPVEIVRSNRARPKSARRSKRPFAISA